MNGFIQPARTLLIACLVAAAVGCSEKSAPPAPAAAPPPAPKPAPKPFDGATRVKWYQECWGFFNDKKWDDFRRCYAPDAVSWSSGDGRPDRRGINAILASAQDLAKLAPDVRGEQQLILVNRDHLASVSVLHGKNTGPTKDPAGKEGPPTGKTFSLLMGHLIDVNNDTDQVTSETVLTDGPTMAVQLGLVKGEARPRLAIPKGPPKIVIGTNDAGEQANLVADKSALAAWNRHDQDALAKFLAPGYVAHDITMAKDMDAHANDQANYDYWRAFSDARLNARYWTAGDYVVVAGHFEGTNDGDFAPAKLAKTGKKASIPFIQIDRLADRKIKESWVFFDSAALTAQLGSAPAGK